MLGISHFTSCFLYNQVTVGGRFDLSSLKLILLFLFQDSPFLASLKHHFSHLNSKVIPFDALGHFQQDVVADKSVFQPPPPAVAVVALSPHVGADS